MRLGKPWGTLCNGHVMGSSHLVTEMPPANAPRACGCQDHAQMKQVHHRLEQSEHEWRGADVRQIAISESIGNVPTDGELGQRKNNEKNRPELRHKRCA